MNGMYEELLEKLRKNNRMSGWTHIDRLIDEAAEAIEALQQENEQLRAQVVRMRETLKEIFELLEEHEPIWYLRKHYNLITAALSDTPADYHNPADVDALRKAREAIQRAKENFEPYGEYEYDVRYDLEKALAAIDKAIGGKEDAE